MSATLTPRKTQRYGWRPQLPDARDLVREVVSAKRQASADLRALFPPVYDQLQLGSCTANGIVGVMEFEAMREGEGAVMMSRLFVYYHERLIEGTVGQDAGAQVRDGLKVVAKLGVPPETDWPYVPAKFAVKPPVVAERDAAKHLAIEYLSVPQTEQGLQGMLSEGVPIVFGFTVYSPFESGAVAQTGIVPMPTRADEVMGGHAVVLAGFNQTSKPLNGCPPGHYIVRNSWGSVWGDMGYFYLPMAYVHNRQLASDFWSVKRVS